VAQKNLKSTRRTTSVTADRNTGGWSRYDTLLKVKQVGTQHILTEASIYQNMCDVAEIPASACAAPVTQASEAEWYQSRARYVPQKESECTD